MILEICKYALAGGFFVFLEFLIKRHDAKKDSPDKKVLKALARKQLEEMFLEWKHSDVRTSDMWEDIEDLYQGYEGLNGNGKIKKLYIECKEIETTE